MKLDHLLDNTTSLRMPKRVLKRPKGLILTHRRCTAQWGENFSLDRQSRQSSQLLEFGVDNQDINYSKFSINLKSFY